MTEWCERQVRVPNPQGVHARPAQLIAQAANRFKSDITIRGGNGQDVNAKAMVKVMTLAAEKGTTLTLRARGEDAEQAVAALAELVSRGFGEMPGPPAPEGPAEDGGADR